MSQPRTPQDQPTPYSTPHADASYDLLVLTAMKVATSHIATIDRRLANHLLIHANDHNLLDHADTTSLLEELKTALNSLTDVFLSATLLLHDLDDANVTPEQDDST